ncbi:MAG TPA: hypothetical protein VG735_07900 [Caulobacterales bacterium]|nr:hypothetical protein [Caulobacterales bacterium]
MEIELLRCCAERKRKIPLDDPLLKAAAWSLYRSGFIAGEPGKSFGLSRVRETTITAAGRAKLDELA